MKKYLKNITGILACILIVSCNDYLDVQPEDKYLEEDVFSSEASIYAALNGIYSNMTSNNTYGGNLTLSTVDVLAQRYKALSDRHKWYFVATYDYTDAGTQNRFDNIWTDLYINILNINNFIAGLETYKGVLSSEKENLLKGEAIALRAMHHLDLLRLYGPIYSINAGDFAIPYNTEPKAKLSPVLTATEVMTKILEDLSTAEELLTNDSVRESGAQAENEGDNYSKFRNLRLNYFAVKALLARANLYAGNTTEALAAAKAVINEATPFFPWVDDLAVISAGANPDRTFSTEVLFGIQNNNIYNQHRDIFGSALDDNTILAPESSRLNNDVFENNQHDIRFNSTWILPSVGGKQYKTFFKFADIEDKRVEYFPFRYWQPLIRMTEMYYIAAETEPDPTLALSYLNTVRLNRGLEELPLGVDISNEILKEYRREFYGEGQLFFYYKRNNFSSIPDGSLESGSINMTADQYVVPLPLSETDFRN